MTRSKEGEAVFWKRFRRACRNAREEGNRHLTVHHLREAGLDARGRDLAPPREDSRQ